MGHLPYRKRWLSLWILAVLTPAAQAAADDDISAIEKITVTGEKTSRSIQDTAASVDVTTGLKIEQENIQSLYEVLNKAPNVTQMYGNRGFTIRGISDEAGAANPLSTIYIDGAPLPSQISDTGPSDLWDVTQVEILRGPQSTIQGENALAGSVILKTAEPTMEWNGKARALWSDPNDKRLSVALGGPLIEDELAFRFSADKHLMGGYVDNITHGGKEDKLNSLLMRGKLLWTPSAIEGLKVSLNYTRDNRDGPYMYTYSRLDLNGHKNSSNRQNRSDITTDLATLTVEYQQDNWLFSSVTSYSESDVERFYDIDLRAEDTAWGYTKDNYQVYTQELRANYESDGLTAIMGLYLSQHKTDTNLSTLTNIDTPLPTITSVLQGYGLDADTASTISASYGAALPQIPVDYQALNDSKSDNQAIFADVDYQLNEHWSVLLGFRFDHQKYRFSSDAISAFAGTLPDPVMFGAEGTMLYQLIGGINNQVLGLVAQAGGSNPETSTTTDSFLPKVGIRYRFNDDTSLTATYQQGYRSGGSSFNIARSDVVEYDPEYTDNYELAWRQRLPAIDAVFNANLFYVDWRDRQVSANFGLNTYDTNIVNAGNAHLYGLEASFKQQLTNDIDWYWSYGYSKTQYDSFDAVNGGSVTDYSGQEFNYAANHTASAGVNVYLNTHVSWNINANYRSKVYTSLSADRGEVSSRTLFNTRLAYDDADWSAYLFANNLFDKDYVQYLRTDNNGILGDPRVVGIGVEARW